MKDSKKEQNENIKQKKFEAKQNQIGFFSILLRVDMKNNPEQYKKIKQENNYD